MLTADDFYYTTFIINWWISIISHWERKSLNPNEPIWIEFEIILGFNGLWVEPRIAKLEGRGSRTDPVEIWSIETYRDLY